MANLSDREIIVAELKGPMEKAILININNLSGILSSSKGFIVFVVFFLWNQ